MAIIAIACHDTEDNGRTHYTQETLESLSYTVDLRKHRIVIIDNNSCDETKQYLKEYAADVQCMMDGAIRPVIITLNENVGTARAINFAIQMRQPGEVVCKMDNDVVVHSYGWVEELEQTIAEHPEIGILGLKRDDVYGDFTEEGKLLWSDDVIGTCTAFNPLLLDKVGYLMQPSVYGFDDVLMSVRS